MDTTTDTQTTSPMSYELGTVPDDVFSVFDTEDEDLFAEDDAAPAEDVEVVDEPAAEHVRTLDEVSLDGGRRLGVVATCSCGWTSGIHGFSRLNAVVAAFDQHHAEPAGEPTDPIEAALADLQAALVGVPLDEVDPAAEAVAALTAPKPTTAADVLRRVRLAALEDAEVRRDRDYDPRDDEPVDLDR